MKKHPSCERLAASLGVALATLAIPLLAWAQPANDDCANAMPVANHSVTAIDMTAATRDNTATVSCNGSSSRRDLWFTYTAAGAEQVTVSMCGSPAGTRRILTAYSGGCGSAELACDENDACGT